MSNLLTGMTGHIIFMHLLGQPMIVLSSQRIVRDLMDKRSSIYSDRPRFVLFSELFVALHIHHKPVLISLRMGWQDASTHVR